MIDLTAIGTTNRDPASVMPGGFIKFSGNESTTRIEYNTKLLFAGSSASTLNLSKDSFQGCNVVISNIGRTNLTVSSSFSNSSNSYVLNANAILNLTFMNGKWHFDNRISWLYDSITLDFIGDDSLMQPLLLDKILSYWASRLYTAHSENAEKWKKNWRASISSNGTLFANPEVRAFIDDWLPVLSIGVSIDGCPAIHDENRIFVDGRPSMPVILQWWDWYRERFPNDSRTTKATCSRNSIPYLFDSLRFMHEEMGLNWINQNFIMEDTASTPQDYQLLRQQMDKCIDYVFDHRTDLYWSMIDRDNFALAHRSEGDDWEKKGHCGSGTMPALGIDGKIYPCFRFLPHTQEVASPVICGDTEKGLYNKEAFTIVCESSYRANCTTKEECKNCDCESGCTYCIAGCYSEFGEFKRQTYICEYTKIQSEYAKKYWNRWEKANGTDCR